MGYRGVRFNNGIEADLGIGVGFSRAAATVNAAGSAIGVNVPAYAASELYVAAPSRTSVDDTSTNSRMMAHNGGLWTDGTSPAIVIDRRTGLDYRINLHVGTAVSTNALKANAARTANILSDIADPLGAAWKQGNADLVRLAGAGRGEAADLRHEPHCFVVRDGLAMATGETYRRDATYTKSISSIVASGGNARVTITGHGLVTGDKVDVSGSNSTPSINGLRTVTYVDANTVDITGITITVSGNAGTAANRSTVVGTFMAYWDETAHLASPGSNYWTIPSDFRYNTSINPAHGAGIYKGSRWMIQPAGLAKSSDGLTLYAGWGNYESNPTGQYTVVQTARFTRASATSPWTYDSGVLNFNVDRGSTTNGTHVHSVGIVIQADGSLVWLVCMGDTANQHYMIGYAASWASISGAGSYSQTTNSKTTQNGQTWWSCAHGDPWATARIGASQTMGLAWTGSGLNWIATADETAPTVVLISITNGHVVTASSTVDQVRLDIVSLASRPTNDAYRGWNAFNIATHPRGYGPPYYTWSRANTAWQSTLGPARFEYSPDGTSWGFLFAPNLGGASNLGFGVYGDYIVYGSNGTDLYAVPRAPASMTRQGLKLRATANNYRRTDALTIQTGGGYLGAGITASVGKPSISGRTLSDPPAGAPESYHVFAVTNNVNGGIVQIAANVPKGSGVVKVHGWINAELQEIPDTVGTAPFACAAMQVTMQAFEMSGLPGTARSASQVSVITSTGSGWTPFTVQFADPNSWTNNAGIPNPFDMGIRVMNTPNTTAARCGQVRIAWAAVTVGDIDFPLDMAAAQSTTTLESSYLSCSGWSCGDAWTAYIAGMIPREGPDEYSTNRPTTRVLFTLKQSPTKYITATADPSTDKIRFTFVDGGTSTNVDVTANTGQELEFSKLSQVLVGISKTGTSYRLSVSVGGTLAKEVTQTIGSTDIRPRELLAGDQNGQNLECWTLADARIDEAAAATAAEMTTQLQALTIMTYPPTAPSLNNPLGFGF